jgi:flavin reductase (DIM6/NTAB) family NADH-FMN oxidoreductase RutF
MDADAKKTALRMIPYGIYVLTAEGADGTVAAATVNWVTQTSFNPPLVAIGVKTDSGVYATLREAGNFALNFLGKGQQGAAFTFFKPAEVADGAISGEPYSSGSNGAPLLDNAIASVECKVATVVELGDHHIIVGEVTEAKVNTQPEGRADHAVLHMGELGDNVFYGG